MMKFIMLRDIFKIRPIFIALSFFAPVLFQLQAANPVSIKIAVDSASLLMGKQTAMHVEITEDADGKEGRLILSPDTLVKNVEIAYATLPDTSKAGDNRRIIRQDIVLQSFDSGLYLIPPVKYLSGTGDTVLSNPLSLKVLPVNVDTLETIHSFAPVMPAGSKWWDMIPDILLDYWIYLLIVIAILIIGVVVWLTMKKKISVPFISQPKQLPPYEQALQSLDNLRDRRLCEQGREKEYYTELTDILRRYLEAQFGINAMEMTSSQILNNLRENPAINMHHNIIRRILEIADFVKFAKVRPLPSDNVASWNNAHQFVLDTKPAEKEEKTGDDVEEASKPLDKTKDK